MSIQIRVLSTIPTEVLEAVDRLVPYTLNMNETGYFLHREYTTLTLHTRSTTSPHRLELALLALEQYKCRD
jgi:hypothetical protein